MVMLENINKFPNWTTNLRTKLNNLGFSFIWHNQSIEEINFFKNLIINRFKDQIMQQNAEKISKCKNFPHYRELTKTNYESPLLDKILPLQIFKTITQIRVNLNIVKVGNFIIVPLGYNVCQLCNKEPNKKEDILHIWLKCPFYNDIRDSINFKSLVRFSSHILFIKSLSNIKTNEIYMFYNLLNIC